MVVFHERTLQQSLLVLSDAADDLESAAEQAETTAEEARDSAENLEGVFDSMRDEVIECSAYATAAATDAAECRAALKNVIDAMNTVSIDRRAEHEARIKAERDIAEKDLHA